MANIPVDIYTTSTLSILLQDFFSPSVPTLSGHTALKNKEVDQIEQWAAKQGVWNDSKETVQSSQRGRGMREGCPQSF